MCLRIILNLFNLKDMGWALKVIVQVLQKLHWNVSCRCGFVVLGGLITIGKPQTMCKDVQSTFQKGKPMTSFRKPYGF